MQYYKINPGGNITAIVLGSYEPQRRVEISKIILAQDPEIEQVGFWVEPNNKTSDARVEMMGGEFCGNASRCLALIAGEASGKESLVIECSGFPLPINALVTYNASTITLPKNVFEKNNTDDGPLITMPGIEHLVLNKIISKQEAEHILQKTGLIQRDAAGVMSLENVDGHIYIRPYVWVKATETLYAETACGSGTLAAALVLAGENSTAQIEIIQPSRASFTVIIDEKTVSLRGPIISREKIERAD